MILLANPNTNAGTTAAMCAIARPWLPDLHGWTAPQGPSVILDPDQLDRAADQIAALEPPPGCRGVIVAAFGDPGAARLALRLGLPVIGIGAAAARAAGHGGLAFAVATTTPALTARIDTLMQGGPGRYLGCHVTPGAPEALMADPAALDRALLAAIHRAAGAGAQAVIIGGGPLAQAALRLQPHSPVPLIQPVPEAARAMAALLA
ncbi:MAG: aspartate/glutamate racemase family protein [Paracoccus hibiscisoli]|uniref:aspartate/glutamate racemase family protein n=1 Tax=Paracoccus hibiscisoli TaxID=2023261 RepID=UPI00391C2E60